MHRSFRSILHCAPVHFCTVLGAVAVILGACAGRSDPAPSPFARLNCTSVPPAGQDTSAIYLQDAVDERALALPSDRLPRTPQELLNAPRHEARAEAVVEAVVDTAGWVEPCSIRLVSTTHQAWGEAVVTWARSARYRPARVGGRPVRSRVRMSLTREPDK